MKKKFYRFPNGSYFRLDSISFVGKVQECGCRYRKYKLTINVDGNALDSEADDYDYLEKARRELLKELHLEYMPIPLRRIRRCRRIIRFRNRIEALRFIIWATNLMTQLQVYDCPYYRKKAGF